MTRDTRSPIERMIDAAVRCTKCGTQGLGNCDCWDKPKPAPKRPRKKKPR